MKEIMKVVGAVIGITILVFLLFWVATGNDLALFQYFGPKYEQTRRNVFETSKAYNDGMVQELRAMQFEWIKADTNSQAALGSVFLHRVAQYDNSKLPPDLQEFVRTLKRQQLETR